MTLTTFLGGLVALIIVGLLVSATANYYQQKRAELAKQIKQLRASGEHLAEIAQKIDQISTHKSMAAELIGMAAKNFQNIIALRANSADARDMLQSAQQFAKQLAQGQGTANPCPRFDSAAEIAKAKQLLTDAEKIFRRMHDRGTLNSETFSEYYRELRWLYIDVEVSSYLHQGLLARERNDRVKSGKYFQSALNILKKSASADPRKQTKLAEVEALIDQQRTTAAKT